ncbi:MAG: ABC transporter ATP-binding protein [Spirochaetales bacterium]|nr:ABC transporter ATP-binding protein [Spirochaetales bacterium]
MSNRSPNTAVVVRNVTKRFSEDSSAPNAVQDVNFDVSTNEFVTILGRSGCGKSTMLNIIAGLITPTMGEVVVNNRPVDGPGTDRGMVFQHSGLFPWLTAIENIEFGPRNKGVPKSERRLQARELIELVRLEACENKYPRELSGGMQQRVAIARAMAMDPEILLMDEPFGALDQLTREDMQRELLRIWQSRKKTVLFVTHAILEAVFLSDRVLVFNPKPGFVRREFRIDIPRPRQKASPEFMRYYEEIYEAIG